VFKIQVCMTVHMTVASVLGGIVTSFLTTHLGPVKSVCSLPSSLLLSPSPHCPPSPASLLCPSPPSWSEFVPWSPRVWAALPRVPCESTGGSEGLDPRPGRSWPERGRGGWLQGRRKMRREKRNGEGREKERNGEGRRNKVRRKVGREKRGGEEKQTRRDGMIQVHHFQFLVVPLTSFFEAESLPVGGTRGGNLITCLQLLNLHMKDRDSYNHVEKSCGTPLTSVIMDLYGRFMGSPVGCAGSNPPWEQISLQGMVERTFGIRYTTKVKPN